MEVTGPMDRKLFHLVLLLTLVVFCAGTAEGVIVETSVGGETIEWELNVPSVHPVGCEKVSDFRYECEYTAQIPPPLARLSLKAEITPSIWDPAGNVLDLYYIPYQDYLRVEAHDPPYSLENWRNDLLYLPDPLTAMNLVEVYRIVYLRWAGGTNFTIAIKIYFFNGTGSDFFTPHFGGPGDNPFSFFSNQPCEPGKPKRRIPKRPGGGPGW
jgi:hypothetical protein